VRLLSLAREYKLGDDASRDLFAKGGKLISKISYSCETSSNQTAHSKGRGIG
jgi:hypothetical protein